MLAPTAGRRSLDFRWDTNYELQNKGVGMGRVDPARMGVHPRVSLFVWVILTLLVLSSPAPAQSQSPLTLQALQAALSKEQGYASPAIGQQLEVMFKENGHETARDPNEGITAGVHRPNMSVGRSPFQQTLQSTMKFSVADPDSWRFQLRQTRAAFAALPFGPLHHSQQAAFDSTGIMVAPVALVDPLVAGTDAKGDKLRPRKRRSPRALGFVPNYYVAYVHNAVPLTVHEKFKLAWNSAVDPFTFGFAGTIAGFQQALNNYNGFGQGAQGYAKRFGAYYAGHVTGTFFESALLPSLLKQDPRYFYKGLGSKRGRLLYAIANSVICEGDNRHWQTNYSNIFGNIAASAVSNFYHPPQNWDGPGRIFLNALIGIGTTAALNIVQEFFAPRLISVVPGQPMTRP